MKKTILAILSVVSISAFAQNTVVDVIMDGKPAKLNTETGVFTFTKGVPESYTKTPIKTDASVSIATTKENNKASVSKTNTDKIHTVSQGETLYSISKKYGISMAQIKSLNALKSNVLSIDQQLKIGYNTSAELKGSSVYTVLKGDTLYSIAKKHNLSVQELKALNGLENNTISIGQSLIIK